MTGQIIVLNPKSKRLGVEWILLMFIFLCLMSNIVYQPMEEEKGIKCRDKLVARTAPYNNHRFYCVNTV